MSKRDDFTKSKKGMMLLSCETRLGLRMTGDYAFTVYVDYCLCTTHCKPQMCNP